MMYDGFQEGPELVLHDAKRCQLIGVVIPDSPALDNNMAVESASFSRRPVLVHWENSYYISFRFWTKWKSIWFKIEGKTVITIIFHSMWKDMEILFSQCIYRGFRSSPQNDRNNEIVKEDLHLGELTKSMVNFEGLKDAQNRWFLGFWGSKRYT